MRALAAFAANFVAVSKLLLCDVPTPAVVVDLDLLEQRGLDLATATAVELEGALFVHSSVVNVDARDASDARHGSGHAQEMATLDVPRCDLGLKPTLALGLNNHHAGSYFWAKSSGAGASMPAPGILLGTDTDGLTVLVRDPDQQSNDGKRSEWCDFVRPGDQVQILPGGPADMQLVLGAHSDRQFGARRAGRPPGVSHIVCCHALITHTPLPPRASPRPSPSCWICNVSNNTSNNFFYY